MKTPFIILVLLLSCTLAFGQTPESFKYQAVIGNASGDILVNTTVALRISVLQDTDHGAVVYEETFHPTSNPHGLVDVEIGNSTFYSIDWATHSYFLKIEVDPANGSSFTHLGTSPLLSVPYALHARTVEEDMVEDADADPGNELQTLSLVGNDLSISDGNSVLIPSTGGADNWGAQVVESDATLSGVGTSGDPLSVVGDLTDNQTLSIAGSDLTISEGNTVTLPSSGGGDNWGTQAVESDATLSGVGTSGDPLSVAGDLTDDQTLSLAGNDLTISDGNTVALPSSPWSLGNPGELYYMGNIGLNIADPAQRLHVVGNTTMIGNLGLNVITPAQRLHVVGNSALMGNVGIGTTTPSHPLHVDGIGMFELNGGSISLSTPGGNPGLIAYTGSNGNRRDVIFDVDGIGLLSSTSSSLPGTADGLWIIEGGNVGIQSWTPGNYPLLVNQRGGFGLAVHNGSTSELWELYVHPISNNLELYRGGSTYRGAFDAATGTYAPVSDRQVKTDIRPMTEALGNLKKLNPSTYKMKDFDREKREIGIVAQELRRQFPELVFENKDKSGKTILTVNYGGIAVVAVKAIQEQQEIIEEQTETIDELSERIGDLERRLESLQRGMKRLR